MDRELANARFERKFLPAGWSVAETLAFVRRHPAVFHEPYPERVVNNLYFDTPDLRHFHDHINGAAHRLKVRLRWYGAFGGAVTEPRLEFKFRRGTVSGKETHPFPAFGLNGHFPPAILEVAWRSETLSEKARFRLRGVRPLLGNRYRRRYFRSADGAIRLTVDWGLEFFEVQDAEGTLRRLPRSESVVIIELKYPAASIHAAAAVTAHLPFRVVRCSKYVIGVERLYGVAA